MWWTNMAYDGILCHVVVVQVGNIGVVVSSLASHTDNLDSSPGSGVQVVRIHT